MAAELSLSQRLSRFAADLSFADLPEPVVAAAKRHILDVIGVGLVGARQAMAARAREGLHALPGASGACHVWGTDMRLAAPYAAVANGVATHVLDFDDTHTDSITHGSAVLGPTILALGEQLDLSGAELIAAFVLGWEVTARVGLASRGTFHKRGFHTTSIAGIFGATAAAGKLLGLGADQMSHALGLTGSQVSGVSEYLSNGSSSKSFHPGWAAHAGIVAAHLARAGMTGPMTVLEGRYGLFKTYGLLDESDPNRIVADLGDRWETTRISIKPYPCCHFAHGFIDCAKALRAQGLKPDDIERLECIVPEIELPLICEPFAEKLRPDSPYAAKFSLPFLVAAALTDGSIGHETFTPDNIRRGDLLDLAARVSYRVAAPDETTFPKYFPGWIRGRAVRGDALEQRLDINYGNPDNPMTAADIEQKFRANARGALDGDRAEACIALVQSLETANVRDLAGVIAADGVVREQTRRRA